MLKVKCPHCGEVHEISVRETYINGALSDASRRLHGVV
jgi:phage FluMu protein Com